MKRIVTLTLLLLFAIGFSACEKIADDTPQAIKKLIRKHSKSGNFESVAEYKCEEKTVYWFIGDAEIDDGISYLFDKEGNKLCYAGGFGGKICEEYKNCTEEKIIWTNKKYTKK